jgi:HD-GYP domain-containing protein (c-di-GMP phosphodiesterase class II)
MLEDHDIIKAEVRTIVLQHHERPNGMGYPNKLFNKEIYYPAKIVSVADSFSEKIVVRESQSGPINAVQALAIMRDDIGRFDDEIFAVFEKIISQSRVK